MKKLFILLLAAGSLGTASAQSRDRSTDGRQWQESRTANSRQYAQPADQFRNEPSRQIPYYGNDRRSSYNDAEWRHNDKKRDRDERFGTPGDDRHMDRQGEQGRGRDERSFGNGAVAGGVAGLVLGLLIGSR